VDAQRVRLQIDRILASATFADAGRASSFLRFVVERKLEGHAGEIKESVIAVEVLGRTPSFDSKSDPIVRVEAGRLRERLNSFYAAEGGTDPILISLPKGRNVPEFTERRPREASQSTGVLRLSILPPENDALGPSAGFFGSKTARRNRQCILAVLVADSLSIGFFVPKR
jgi:hypothetical protein